MFGIPIDGPTNVYCDNKSVVINATKPESTLKKKHNAIVYHRVRKTIAAGTIHIAKEDSSTNIADMLTQPVPATRLKELCSFFVYIRFSLTEGFPPASCCKFKRYHQQSYTNEPLKQYIR
jgi:hypothetical protein